MHALRLELNGTFAKEVEASLRVEELGGFLSKLLDKGQEMKTAVSPKRIELRIVKHFKFTFFI